MISRKRKMVSSPSGAQYRWVLNEEIMSEPKSIVSHQLCPHHNQSSLSLSLRNWGTLSLLALAPTRDPPWLLLPPAIPFQLLPLLSLPNRWNSRPTFPARFLSRPISSSAARKRWPSSGRSFRLLTRSAKSLPTCRFVVDLGNLAIHSVCVFGCSESVEKWAMGDEVSNDSVIFIVLSDVWESMRLVIPPMFFFGIFVLV